VTIAKYFKLTRLNQPVGICLLFLPCLFGMALALKKLPNPDFGEILKIALLFLLGSIIMRSAGCVLNDILDHRFDKKAKRTKNRPVASKEVSKTQALILFFLLCLLGLVVLLQFNQAAILSGFVALGLLIVYPLTKRFTNYPQAFLGLTFNFGIIMSSLALLESISISAAILYFCAAIWTIIYDTIYAFQDIEDDLEIGVKSTAIKFKNNPKIILISLSLIMFLGLVLVGWREELQSSFFIIILLNSLFLNKKIKECNFKNPNSCLKTFRANVWVGIMILLALILG